MTTSAQCQELSDRMPTVARGLAGWSPTEDGHLEQCPECSAEWNLVRAGSALGAGVTVRSPELVAARVLQRLRHRATPTPSVLARRPSPWWIGLAAAAAIALAVWAGRSTGRGATSVSGPTTVLLHELDDLNVGELEFLLELLPAISPSRDIHDGTALSDLDDTELESVLHSLEG